MEATLTNCFCPCLIYFFIVFNNSWLLLFLYNIFSSCINLRIRCVGPLQDGEWFPAHTHKKQSETMKKIVLASKESTRHWYLTKIAGQKILKVKTKWPVYFAFFLFLCIFCFCFVFFMEGLFLHTDIIIYTILSKVSISTSTQICQTIISIIGLNKNSKNVWQKAALNCCLNLDTRDMALVFFLSHKLHW